MAIFFAPGLRTLEPLVAVATKDSAHTDGSRLRGLVTPELLGPGTLGQRHGPLHFSLVETQKVLFSA